MPLYGQVREALLRRIRGGEWSEGETLPNEFVLASDFGVSIGTVRRAVAGLEEYGLVRRVQGRGTFVSGPGSAPLQEKFTRLRMRDGNLGSLSFELLGIERRSARKDEIARLPGSEACEVYSVRQALLLGHQRVGIETSVVAADACPRIDTQLVYGQHLYPVLAQYGVLVTRARETLAAVTAEGDISRLLQLADGAPVLRVDRTAYGLDAAPVELRQSYYLVDGVVPQVYEALL